MNNSVKTRAATSSDSLSSIAIMATALTLFVIIGLTAWASLAPLSSAVVASGFVRVEGHRKQVQHYDGGIIKTILVNDGDQISQGDTLIVLDDVDIKNQLQAKLVEYLQLRLLEQRLDAQRQQIKEIAYQPKLIQLAKELDVPALLQQNQSLLEQNYHVLAEKEQLIDSQISQHKTYIRNKNNELKSLREKYKLMKQQTDAIDALAKKQFISNHKLLALQQDLTDLQSQIETVKSTIVQTNEKVYELTLSLNHLQSTQHQKSQQERLSIHAQVAAIKKDIQLLKERLSRVNIIAPISGRITQLKKHTINGIVTAGAVLMEIVPSDERLIIEAHIQPKDIESISNNQQANVRLTAYNARRTPTLKAVITQTSADRLSYQQGGHYYAVTLHIEDKRLEQENSGLNLYPGMPAEVIIPTGKRSLADYLINTILNSTDTAMRES
jgi:HlyD family secretion protein